MVNTYMDLFDTMIGLGLIDRWQLMYKTMYLDTEQYCDMIEEMYDERKYHPPNNSPLATEQVCFKARHFQMNIGHKHVNKSD